MSADWVAWPDREGGSRVGEHEMKPHEINTCVDLIYTTNNLKLILDNTSSQR